jgi:putative RNA 2'-phosphotransferase
VQLFHGTSPQAWVAIQREGLQPMGRQYVHLSADIVTAEQVGRRKSATPVILIVDAKRAHDSGTRFLQGNGVVWLANRVLPDYLSVESKIDKE